MILPFQEQFVSAIISGSKVTTIRQDKGGRWRAGLTINFWKGNPRNTSQTPYEFGLGTSSFVRPIKIDIQRKWIHFDYKWWTMRHDKKHIKRFVKGDGFESPEAFFNFFKETYQSDFFEGVLIGWHNFIPITKGGQT